jgi:hypothetical protein
MGRFKVLDGQAFDEGDEGLGEWLFTLDGAGQSENGKD